MKSERARLTDRLDELILKIIRIRENDTCQRCHKECYGQDSQTSHIIPKKNGASWRRFDLDNVQLLCYTCHLQWWHKNPTEAGVWFSTYFPDLDIYLEKYRHNKPAKITTGEMRELKKEYQVKLKGMK